MRAAISRALGRFERDDQLAVGGSSREPRRRTSASIDRATRSHAFGIGVDDDPRDVELFAHGTARVERHPPVGGPLMS